MFCLDREPWTLDSYISTYCSLEFDIPSQPSDRKLNEIVVETIASVNEVYDLFGEQFHSRVTASVSVGEAGSAKVVVETTAAGLQLA